jgi:hypothetical protein
MTAASDARYERDHGSAEPAITARLRAERRRSSGDDDSAAYWHAYAAEVESWEEGENADTLMACLADEKR